MKPRVIAWSNVSFTPAIPWALNFNISFNFHSLLVHLIYHCDSVLSPLGYPPCSQVPSVLTIRQWERWNIGGITGRPQGHLKATGHSSAAHKNRTAARWGLISARIHVTEAIEGAGQLIGGFQKALLPPLFQRSEPLTIRQWERWNTGGYFFCFFWHLGKTPNHCPAVRTCLTAVNLSVKHFHGMSIIAPP